MSQSLLKLQIGPVQEFIAQARSTRDLWSGSYLISWMMAHALNGLSKSVGAENVVFPALNDADSARTVLQPLVRWLRDENLANGLTVEQVLTSSLPNTILTIVPGDWTQEILERTVVAPMMAEWQNEITKCLNYYRLRCAFSDDEERLFQTQSERFWQITWQLWPSQAAAETLPLLRRLPDAEDIAQELEERLRQTPQAPPDLDRDWAAHYRLVSHRLDARRATRDFEAWPASPLTARDKDSLSGREEAIADRNWLQRARKHSELQYRFRSGDQLGAPNLVKRVWDLARLKPLGLSRPRTYDSVPAVALAPWLERLKVRLLDHPEVETAFWDLVTTAAELQDYIPEQILPRRDGQSLLEWLEAVDASIFHQSSWENWSEPEPGEPRRSAEITDLFGAAIEAVENLCRVAAVGSPGRYFAVLALDGDEMSAWLGGGKYPLTAGFHRSFSRALGRFSLSEAGHVVQKHLGQLIYAGGDDVLAMLPAETSLACAKELAQGFRKFVEPTAPGCTASAGLAIAHMRAPLQDVVQAAQSAEQVAKQKPAKGGLGRNSLAVSLLKRSGETIQWGTRFDSASFPLLELFQQHYRKPPGRTETAMPISGRFPHILAERLNKQGLETNISTAPLGKDLPSVLEIAQAEFRWVIERQTGKGPGVPDDAALLDLRHNLFQAGDAYLVDLANTERPLSQFVNLFAVEAFLARQGE